MPSSVGTVWTWQGTAATRSSRNAAAAFVVARSTSLAKGERRGPVDGDEQMEFALGGAQFGDVDMEIADGVAPEALPFGFVALFEWQAADTMTPQTAMA